jgi:hypothetical protein
MEEYNEGGRVEFTSFLFIRWRVRCINIQIHLGGFERPLHVMKAPKEPDSNLRGDDVQVGGGGGEACIHQRRR